MQKDTTSEMTEHSAVKEQKEKMQERRTGMIVYNGTGKSRDGSNEWMMSRKDVGGDVTQ